MRVIIQRVSEAQVSVNGDVIAAIGKGLLVLLGIEDADSEEDIEWLCGKISRLRIFADQDGLMNLDVIQSRGELLVVSQFTLHAGTKKGNRPSFIKAARPEKAIPLYELFVERLSQDTSQKVQTGSFGAMMQVSLVNDGPVTIFIDSKNKE